MKKRSILFLAAALIVIAVLIFLGKGQKPPSNGGEKTTTTTTTAATTTTTAPAPKRPSPPRTAELAGREPSAILAVGPRWDTFASLEDGTVWYAHWGDGGGAGITRDPEDAGYTSEELVPAFDMKPRKLRVGQWTGFAIDENGVLWGWGSCVPGHKDHSKPRELVRVLDDVTDVDTANGSSMALCADGTLWMWGDDSFLDPNHEIAPPVRIMNGVASMCFAAGGGPALAVDGSGAAYYFDADNVPHKISDSAREVKGGFVFGRDDAVYRLEGSALTKIAANAAQASVVAEGVTVLEKDGRIVLCVENGSKTEIAQNGLMLIPANTPIFIDREGRLFSYDRGRLWELDSQVLYAASGADGALVYVKQDRSLWLIDFMGMNARDERPPQKIAPLE